MIREYKLFHGAVLMQLVDCMHRPISIDELVEEGRLTSYVIDARVGIHIKHSMAKLTPWQFTFTQANVRELEYLRMIYRESFVALVCHTDGMVCLSVEEVASLLAFGQGEQAWIRVSRHRNELYAVTGAAAELPRKRAEGVGMIVDRLNAL